MKASALAIVCVLAASAYAGGDVAVVTTGDAARKAAVSADVAAWLRQHGYEAAAAPSADASDSIIDCIVIGDTACARGVFAKQVTADQLVYVSAETAGGDTTITAIWFTRTVAPVSASRACPSCTDASLRATLAGVLDRLASSVPQIKSSAHVAVAPAPVVTARASAAPPAAVAPPPVAAAMTERVRPPPAHRWHAGLWVGTELPRGALSPGLLLGGGGAFALDENDRWRVRATVDWVRTGGGAAGLLSPTWFPRSAGTLDDVSDLVTIQGGATVLLARFGATSLRAAVSAGVQASHARLTAYGMTRAVDGSAPVATVEALLAGPAGPVRWRVDVGWRESRRDLGPAAAYAEETTSGGVLAVGAAW